MRDAKKPPLLSTRQWVILEILFLANALALTVVGVLAFSDSFAAVRSAPPAAPVTVVQVNSPAVIALAAAGTATPAATSTPIATQTPVPVTSPIVLVTLTAADAQSNPPTTPSNTPTSVVPGLSATPAPATAGARALQRPPRQVSNAQGDSAPTTVLLDVAGRSQSLPLSCESRSAADWAAYFGVAIDELEFFSRLPLSDNPDAGFSGDVNGKWGQIPPNPYGVHAGPVAALLRDYGLSAEARRGMRWEELRAEIGSGRPAVVWVVGHVWAQGKAVDYTATDGALVVVAPYEHTVIAVGYDDDTVTVRDGAKLVTHPLSTFLSSWAVLGNMAITAAP
jgi:uncharacterized protein YvpB